MNISNTSLVEPDSIVICSYVIVLGADTYCHENLNPEDLMTRQITHAIQKLVAIIVVVFTISFLFYKYSRKGKDYFKKKLNESVFSFLEVTIEELKREKINRSIFLKSREDFDFQEELIADSVTNPTSKVLYSRDLIIKKSSIKDPTKTSDEEGDMVKTSDNLLEMRKLTETKVISLKKYFLFRTKKTL